VKVSSIRRKKASQIWGEALTHKLPEIAKNVRAWLSSLWSRARSEETARLGHLGEVPSMAVARSPKGREEISMGR
jgi:hypothetical protein